MGPSNLQEVTPPSPPSSLWSAEMDGEPSLNECDNDRICLYMFQWLWSDSSVSYSLWWGVYLMVCLPARMCYWEQSDCYCMRERKREDGIQIHTQANAGWCIELLQALVWHGVQPQFSPSSFGVHHRCECVLGPWWLQYLCVCVLAIVVVEWGQRGGGNEELTAAWQRKRNTSEGVRRLKGFSEAHKSFPSAPCSRFDAPSRSHVSADILSLEMQSADLISAAIQNGDSVRLGGNLLSISKKRVSFLELQRYTQQKHPEPSLERRGQGILWHHIDPRRDVYFHRVLLTDTSSRCILVRLDEGDCLLNNRELEKYKIYLEFPAVALFRPLRLQFHHQTSIPADQEIPERDLLVSQDTHTNTHTHHTHPLTHT